MVAATFATFGRTWVAPVPRRPPCMPVRRAAGAILGGGVSSQAPKLVLLPDSSLPRRQESGSAPLRFSLPDSTCLGGQVAARRGCHSFSYSTLTFSLLSARKSCGRPNRTCSRGAFALCGHPSTHRGHPSKVVGHVAYEGLAVVSQATRSC
jgi:hypothetical protein